MKTVSAITAGALLAAGGLVTLTGPASAAFTTSCVGSGGAVTVPGDLVVPAGQACDLTGTTVTGAVRVAKGADLVAEDATFQGDVVVAENGYLGLVSSSVAGRVLSSSGFGVSLEESTVSGTYVGRAVKGSEVESALYVEDDSTVAGGVDVKTGQVLVDSSEVGGPVWTRGASYTDVVNSVLLGSITVSGSAEGSVFCDSEVDGDASYTGNAYVLQIGADGPVEVCDGASVWGGDVTISDNMGDVRVSNNIVRGDLAGTGNDPAPRGEGNRVRGEVSGQFADLQPLDEAAPLQAPSPVLAQQIKGLKLDQVAPDASAVPQPRAVVARQDALKDRVQTRADAAQSEAQAAGPADLLG